MSTSSLLASLLVLASAGGASGASGAGATNNAGDRVKQARRGSGMPFIRPNDLQNMMGANYDPKRAENWMSVSEDVEFLPVLQNNNNNNKNNNNKPTKTRTRSLAEEYLEGDETTGAWANYDPYSVQPFVEGMVEYDEYQQAWRLLGFMIDCNNVMDDDYEQSGGSGDEITEEGCARYVLWAAYVDLEYEGGGIGEYQYWDRKNQTWDDTSCQYAERGSGGSADNNGDDDDDSYDGRCAKMDCHLEDTHFSVLGFFKHRNYDDWMEQLFKHEGMCVWTEEEYAFMKNARKAWPKGCSDTGSTVEVDGNDGDDDGSTTSPLYYNIRPRQNGRIAVGLYTDEQCLTEYPADTDMVEDIVGNLFVENDSHDSGDGTYDFSGDSLTESMDRWDSAFDVWHTCHPCVAYDLENTAGTKYTDDDDDYYYYNGQYYYYGNRNRRADRKLQTNNDGDRSDRALGGEYSAEGDVFECYDDAGYTNVNQCMKFSAKTVMKTATFRDLSLGRNQGTLGEYPLSGYFHASKMKWSQEHKQRAQGNFATYFFLVAVSSALCFSIWNLYKVAKQTRGRSVDGTADPDSLLESEGEVSEESGVMA